MSSAKLMVTQTVLNGTIEVLLPTGLTVDGKAGWNITGLSVDWLNMGICVVPTVDNYLQYGVNTETGSQSYIDADCIFQGTFWISGIAASTSAFQCANHVEREFIGGRLTVQPNLVLQVISSGLAATGIVGFELFYDVVKLSDLEVMRLMQGGA